MANHLVLAVATILLTLLFLSPPTATAANSVVLDMDGSPLEAGSQYYVLTLGTRGKGRGGLTAEPLSGPCPLYVGQHRSWTQQGSPVTFYPSDRSQKNITLSSDVNIGFGPNPICRNQGLWQLSSNGLGIFYVTTNGVIGNPDVSTLNIWFRIEQASSSEPVSYKIVYCFLVPGPLPVPAPPEDPPQDGKNRHNDICEQLDATIPVPPLDLSLLSLVPIDNPLPFSGFVFKKVTTTTTSSSY